MKPTLIAVFLALCACAAEVRLEDGLRPPATVATNLLVTRIVQTNYTHQWLGSQVTNCTVTTDREPQVHRNKKGQWVITFK